VLRQTTYDLAHRLHHSDMPAGVHDTAGSERTPCTTKTVIQKCLLRVDIAAE